MEDRMLRRRRIVYLTMWVLMLVFISFYGGNVPYMLFFAMLVNFICMLVYILYVFFSIKIYQSVEERSVTKNSLVSYQLFLQNESFLTYRDIGLEFMEELSEIKGAKQLGRIYIEPNEGITQQMELVCQYSGTYFVGVDTIEVMDYFKIFQIRFPMPQKMKLTVKPRILIPENLDFLIRLEECHDVSQRRNSNDIIEHTVRKYVASDAKNLIHWKNSAKRQQLMVRTMSSEEILKYVIVMEDKVASQKLEGIIQSDKLRELTLSMVYAIWNLGFCVEVFLGNNLQFAISSSQDFEELYAVLTEYDFTSYCDVGDLLGRLHFQYEEQIPFLFLTANTPLEKEHVLYSFQYARTIHLLDVNSFDDLDTFLLATERSGV